MEREGVKLDVKRVAEISGRVSERIATLEREIWELAGEEFTIGSPQQLSEILFNKLGLSKKRRGKTGFSTDARVLQAIRGEHAIVEKVEDWRELSKLKSTYLDALPELIDARTGRLHTTFNQTATTTGRLSSTNPNLQNVPIRTELGREIRSCFVAEEGHRLISADYSQVELRVLAHIAGEDALKEIFRRGEDVHTATAGTILGTAPEDVDPGTRSKAKMVNYGIVYGLSAYGLADRLQIPQEEAQEFIDRYLDGFPKVKEFIESTIEHATEEGHVSTLFGRIRRIPELRARQWTTRSLGERLAVNTVIQGTAADILKVAMLRCRDALSDMQHEARAHRARRAALRGARTTRSTPRRRSSCARWRRPSSSSRRSRWTWGWGSTGRTRSSGEGARAPPDRRRWRPDRACRRRSTRCSGSRSGPSPPRACRSSSGRSRSSLITVLVGGGFGDVGEARHLSWYYLIGRHARRGLRDDGAGGRAGAGGRRRDGRDDRRAADALARDRPARDPRRGRARDHMGPRPGRAPAGASGRS